MGLRHGYVLLTRWKGAAMNPFLYASQKFGNWLKDLKLAIDTSGQEKWSSSMSLGEREEAMRNVRLIQTEMKRLGESAFCSHARDRMASRNLNEAQVQHALDKGTIQTVKIKTEPYQDVVVGLAATDIMDQGRKVEVAISMTTGNIVTVAGHWTKNETHVKQHTPRFKGNVNDVLKPYVDIWKGKPNLGAEHLE